MQQTEKVASIVLCCYLHTNGTLASSFGVLPMVHFVPSGPYPSSRSIIAWHLVMTRGGTSIYPPWAYPVYWWKRSNVFKCSFDMVSQCLLLPLSGISPCSTALTYIIMYSRTLSTMSLYTFYLRTPFRCSQYFRRLLLYHCHHILNMLPDEKLHGQFPMAIYMSIFPFLSTCPFPHAYLHACFPMPGYMPSSAWLSTCPVSHVFLHAHFPMAIYMPIFSLLSTCPFPLAYLHARFPLPVYMPSSAWLSTCPFSHGCVHASVPWLSTCPVSHGFLHVRFPMPVYMPSSPWLSTYPVSHGCLHAHFPMAVYMPIFPWLSTCPVSHGFLHASVPCLSTCPVSYGFLHAQLSMTVYMPVSHGCLHVHFPMTIHMCHLLTTLWTRLSTTRPNPMTIYMSIFL